MKKVFTSKEVAETFAEGNFTLKGKFLKVRGKKVACLIAADYTGKEIGFIDIGAWKWYWFK